jgi:hypothetical protein
MMVETPGRTVTGGYLVNWMMPRMLRPFRMSS